MVFKKIEKHKTFVVGRQVLDILTSGMYDNPLMVYREYIQNSADSIDKADREGVFLRKDGQIRITIDGLNRSISIFDNGLGVSNNEVEKVLLSIGCSSKESTSGRGFRGIGRLGGLAYCRKLRFETRSNLAEQIAIVEWDQGQLSSLLTGDHLKTLDEAIDLLTSVSFRKAGNDEPEHFFKVTLEGVERFYTDQLMDVGAVKKYLSQVAPVSYDRAAFSFAQSIEAFFSDVEGVDVYDISLNGERIYRPYADDFEITKERSEKISGIEFFHFKSTSGEPIAKGWFAKTSFKSSFPPSCLARGMRVRQGNIEVGDEYFLSQFYAERRFATWQIGEVQICGNVLKTNARRDGFEHTSNYQVFLERAGLLGSHLSKLCREASRERCSRQLVEVLMSEVKDLVDGSSIFINEEHFKAAVSLAGKKLQKLNSFFDGRIDCDELATKYHVLLDKFEAMADNGQLLSDKINGQVLNGKKAKKVIEEIIGSIKKHYGKAGNADELINHVLARYLKDSDAKMSIANIAIDV
ncbi:ATP-binding protein [Desulfuromonas sp. KJ2020]|uniref:ATP-binding protein n=1 Tax=Desulfuromonas sp. KJ2020 TaxID=2919173 RepID=UPI0020A75EF6|nr:ATP-binding protein [Desulfuromonas sp. KJ2020]